MKKVKSQKSKVKSLTTPLTTDEIIHLKAGDIISLTGTIYTARDAAHKKIVETVKKKEILPFDLKDQIIYYVGPAPAVGDMPVGSCGPTTSSRMDTYTVPLLERGLKGMIGKGKRSEEVVRAIKKFKSVYFIAVGGAAALLATKVKKAKIIAYPELGTEAIRRLEVKDFPVIVAIDSKGKSILK
jgi:fumarate hydratase subunit beta